jgi:hypothetical protein
MSYYDYINEMNEILTRNGFTRKIRSRIINQETTLNVHEAICETDDKTRAYQLYDLIYDERCKISDGIKCKLDDLLWLNNCLIRFGHEAQPTKTSALRMFKKHVHMLIYDLEYERYDKAYESRIDMIRALRKNVLLRYPINVAKRDPTLKLFLVKL